MFCLIKNIKFLLFTGRFIYHIFDIDTSHKIIEILKGTSVKIALTPIGKTFANHEILTGEVTGGT